MIFFIPRILQIKTILLFLISILFYSHVFSQTTGNSLDFAGGGPGSNSDYIDLGGDSDFGKVSNFNGDFTFEAWVFNDGTDTWGRIFDFGDSQNDYIIFTPKSTSGQCRFEYRTGGGFQYKIDGGVFPSGVWTHVACRLPASGQASILINGVQVAGATGWPPLSNIVGTTKNYLGKSIFNDPYFKGKMKEVRVWKEYRSAALINEWMDCEISGTEPNLIGYYKLNEGIVGAENNDTDFNASNFGYLSSGDGELRNFELSGSEGNWVADSPWAEDVTEQNVVEFHNRTDNFLLNNESEFDFDSEYTVEYWLFPNYDSGTYQLPLIKGEVGQAMSFYSDHNDGKLYFGQRTASGSQSYATAYGLEYNRWTHITLTAKVHGPAIVNKIYFDGILKATSFHYTTQIPQTNEKVRVGGDFWGKMANIRFWDKALEDDQIASNISTVYPQGTPNLVSQYVQYDNYVAGLVDNIGNNDGVRTATPVFSSDPCFVQFIQQPQSAQLPNFGTPINLSADVRYCNDANYSYQWMKDGADVPNANSLTYINNNPGVGDLGKYQVVITACGRTFKSQEVEITVNNPGKVLHFDGADDYVIFADNTGNVGKYSVEARVRFDELPSNQNIISQGGVGYNEISSQLAVTEDGYFQHNSFHNGQMYSVTHPEKIQAHKWYNISMIYNGSKHWLIVEDVYSAQIDRTGAKKIVSEWNIGLEMLTYQPFKGEIDEVRIWNENISGIFDFPVLASEAPVLKHYFRLDEGIAEANNVTPVLTNTVEDYFKTGQFATLHNFDLIGSISNWRGCDRYDNPITINTVSPNGMIAHGASFTCYANAENLDGTESYQWFKNGVILEGETGASITVDNSDSGDDGLYTARVSRFNTCDVYSPQMDVQIRGLAEVINLDEGTSITIPANPATRYTAEMWVKFDESVTNQNILVASNGLGALTHATNQLYTDEFGYLVHRVYDNSSGTNRSAQSLTPLNVNEWYHIAARASTTSGQGASLVINGVSQGPGEDIGSLWTSMNNWTIGGKAQGGISSGVLLDGFDGEMDELRIWNTHRTLAEIQNNRNAELPTGLNDGPLSHYFKFNRGISDGDNSELDMSFVYDYEVLNNSKPVRRIVTTKNFTQTGSDSNFSDCSPINNPDLNYIFLNQSLYIGQPVEIGLDVFSGDTSALNYQWLFDGNSITDQTGALLNIDQMSADSFGVYEVIVSDNCDPQFVDTLLLNNLPTTNACFSDNAVMTNYPDSTQYIFCADPESNGSLCGASALNPMDYIRYGYCGSEKIYEGGDFSFHLPLAEARVVDIKLSNIKTDVDMWVFGDDCDISNCLGSSTTESNEEFIRVSIPAGDYYIHFDQVFVDFNDPNELELNDSLILDIMMYDNNCSFSDPISCGDEVSSNTSGGSVFIDSYGSFTGYNNPEKVFELVVTEPQTLNLTLSNLVSELDLFLLDSLCDSANLLASSRQGGLSEETISYGVSPGTYYLIVDGSQGAFDLEVSCVPYFEASVDETDAYIDLNWSIDKKLCVPQDTGVIIRLITTPNTILYEEEYTTAALTPDVISGTFRHIVGDDHSRMYVLRVYNRLSNATLCNEIQTGSTLPFQQPEILSISQAEAPDSIRIEWRNHSQLSEEFRIYRDGNQIVSLADGYTEDSLIVSYVDMHNIGISSSIFEANTYNYCIETFNNTLNMSYPQVCGDGSTYDINFQATDGGTIDKINLTWNDVSSFSEGIIISRNGIQIQSLSPNELFFNDMSPIHGEVVEYKMTILRDGVEQIMVTNDGFLEANGIVTGKVISKDGYPVQNAQVSISKDSIVDNAVTQVVISSVSTDFEGQFSFTDIGYGLAKTFQVTATKDGSEITPEDITFELNSAIPHKTDLAFIDEQDLIVIPMSLLDTLSIDVQDDEDIVVVNWDYTYSASETMHFILERNGELIYEGNDSQGKMVSFTDLTGVPGAEYSYVLDAFRYNGDDISSEERTTDGVYPLLTPVQGFDFTLDGQEQVPGTEMVGPQVTFDWSSTNHPSQNFDGFRIFRNNILLAEVSVNSTDMYSAIVPPAVEAGYEMRTFRKVNGTSYESAPFPASGDSLITSLPLWKPIVTDNTILGESNRAIVLQAYTDGVTSEFFTNGIFDGVVLQRKLQNEDDSTYSEVEVLTKNFIAAETEGQLDARIWDALGIPNANYTYKMSTYLDLNGQRYSRDTIFDRMCPAIIPPTNMQKTEEIGKVGLTWTDNSYDEGGNSQLYFNYSGYELTRTDITNSGAPIIIATIPAYTESHNDFIDNKVFNLFFDDYIHTDYNYDLRSYLDIDGERYYSAPLSIMAAPLDGSTVEPLPTAFVASNNIPGHIKLCWEWTATKPSEFIVYRDTIPLDTLPSTSRAYYDYDAPEDPSVLYRLTSIFAGVESEAVLAEGRMPSNMNITGRITNDFTGAGIAGVNVIYSNQDNSGLGILAGEFGGSTITDATGNYYFSDIPHTPGYQYKIKVYSNNYDFAADEGVYNSFDLDSINITSERQYDLDFLEYSVPEDTDIVSPIAAVSANPDADSMYVEVTWSPENGYYDGFQIYRVNQLIAEIKKGQGFSHKDRGGFPGVDYVYTVRAYKAEEGGRKFSEYMGAEATFPAVLPVENLTVTAYTAMNKMLVSWSHPLDNHDTYRIRRNGDFMASIPAGDILMWYDETGIPGLEYQYEVTAIKGPNISRAEVVTAYFKGVGEARELETDINEFEQACTGILTNDNHVSISWEYHAGAADGFEVYRDGGLIAEIDSVVLAFGDLPMVAGDTLMNRSNVQYDDYTGVPGDMHTYHILPFVIREGAKYTSGIEELFLESTIQYPQIAEVSGIDISQNNFLGSAQIDYEYDAHIVSGFQVLRNGEIIDTIVASLTEIEYSYQDFTGLPGDSYTYAVRPYGFRSGMPYYGGVTCNETITYPIVPTPQNFTASQGTYENHILVNWDFSLEAFVDSFYLENITLGTLETFGSGKRKFIDVVNDFTEEKYEYKIQASRISQGQTIYSEWSEIQEGWSSRQISGNQDEIIENDILTSYNGYSLDIDGDWAVSGAPNGLEAINIYRRVNGGWSLFQTIYNPWGNHDYDFGFSVAISGETIVVGVPKNLSIAIYEFDGQNWNTNPQIFTTQPHVLDYGWAVDIDGDDIVVGAPRYGPNVSTPQGAVFWYERQSSGLWTGITSQFGSLQGAGSDEIHFGYGVAIHDGFTVVSWKRPGGNFNEAIGYVKEGQSWNWNNWFNGSLLYTYNPSLYRDNIDYQNEVLVIGDPNFNTSRGKVTVVELENNAVANSFVINGPNIINSHFGISTAVNKIPSPINDEIYVAVGSYLDDGGPERGRAFLYSNIGTVTTEISQINNDNPADYDYVGWSVAVSDDAWGSGIPRDNLLDNGSVVINNLLSAPSVVDVTDGISLDLDPAETTVSWEFNGNYDLLAGFNIYRDEEFLTYRDKATMTLIAPDTYADNWNDNSGEAGLPYVYAVRSVNNLIPFESYGTSEEGYNRADGKIIGAVKTQMGFVPVPGVTITATGLVAGEIYTYTTTTQPNGEYVFNSVFYDPDETTLTEYELKAEYLDHIIIPQTTDVAYLNPLSDPSQGVVDFFDVTAYVIKGSVVQQDVSCPIEGLKITQIINNVPASGQEAYTDADGNYSLVVNPFESGLQEIRIRIDQSLTEDEVTTTYNFQPTSDTTFTDFSSFPIITELNYEDVLTYDVSLKVKNTCNDAISNGKWSVRVRTQDGCYDEQFVTNSNGDLVVPLIPQNYTLSVVGVDIPTSVNQQALDYYANFPLQLNLLDIHRDSIETLTKVEIEDMAARQFTFHKAAQIEVNGFNEIICNTQTAILQQGQPYTLTFDIFENHNGTNCSVEEGIVVITNPAAVDSDPVTIHYNNVQEQFDNYTFTTGGPQMIFPHAYAVTFDYKTVDGIFLGRKTEVVFVEGAVNLPGTDILVDPASGNDAVPYPLLVLRDPPGDGSSSYIEAGQTIGFQTELSMDNEFGGKLYTEVEAQFFGIGTEINANINGGYAGNNTIGFENSVTTTTRISTDSDDTNIGRAADIIVGTGLVMQFGYIREFRVDPDECSKVQSITKYAISSEAATTTWSYQIGQVEDIIQGYKNDSIRVEEGTLDIERGDALLTKEEALTFLSSNINNWTQVLHYHDVETVPHYYVCTFDANQAGQLHAEQIGFWQAQLRPFIVDEVDGGYKLKEDIIWDDQLINLYNAAAGAIRNLLIGNDLSIWSFPYVGDQNSVDLNIPLINLDLVDLAGTLTEPDLTDYTSNFGDQVKNITTGGGVIIEESINNVQSSTTSKTNTIYIGSELDVAITGGGSSEIIVGTFAGVGGGVTFATVQNLFETSFKVGASFETTLTTSNSNTSTLEESVEVGYTIFDDESVDAFSMAVIQPVANNSTPYFDFFGGHTSCPPEEGSVFVDAPLMDILYDNGGSGPTKELFNVPAEEAATFQIIVTNDSPINSQPTRELEIFLWQSSNDNGAIVDLNGVNLNTATYIDSFVVGSIDTLTLTIQRGPTSYDYPDIQIGIEPTCGRGPRKFVYASAYFVNPCSPVTLITPTDNWLMNDDTTKLIATMQDHDPSNPFLVNSRLQYRRLNTTQDWTDVPAGELQNGNYIIPDSLEANDEEYAEGQIPKYFYIWSVPTTEGLYPDGNYEVRAKMSCNNFSSTLSNVIPWTKARDGLNLFGNPQPSDQLWTSGDEISFTFNKDLDCPLINQSFVNNNISVYNETTGAEEPFSISCYANKLIFVLDNPMTDYDGQFLTINVDDIPSIVGNISLPHSWTFRVITKKIYWADADTVKVRMYQDEIQDLTIGLQNSTLNETLSGLTFIAADNAFGDWLTIIDPMTQPFAVNPSGINVTFELDASESVGVYNETVKVLGVPNPPEVHIQLEVLVKPPNWVVDPGDYSTSMNMIANWRYETDDPDSLSRDNADLISAWVGNEIRGVASITESGQYNAAYMTIYGDVDDGSDTPLEFRIWDADLGIEYDGHPSDTIFYVSNSIRGTTANPEILIVDAEYDRARYIPLRENWTGFSLSDSTSNMDVMHKLRSLESVSDGDLIVTGDKFSMYTDSLGWFNFGASNLATINNNEGYMIYLENGPDTLRITGTAPSTNDIQLKSGWNWLGFPFENAEEVNDVLNLNTINSTGDDRIKIDFPLPGELGKFANYDIVGDNWNDGNLVNMEPYNLYKLYSGHLNGATLSWTPQNNIKDEDAEELARMSVVVVVDPEDFTTWVMPDFDTDNVMPIIGEVIIGGVATSDPNDWVAFFEADTIRALGSIEYIDALGVYEVSMLAEKSASNYDIRFYDASEGVILQATNTLGFDINGVGNVLNPYEIIFEDIPCPDVRFIVVEDGPFVLDKTFEARQEITILGNINIPAGIEIIFSAPKVTIADEVTTGNNATIIIRPDGCD